MLVLGAKLDKNEACRYSLIREYFATRTDSEGRGRHSGVGTIACSGCAAYQSLHHAAMFPPETAYMSDLDSCIDMQGVLRIQPDVPPRQPQPQPCLDDALF